MAGVTGLLDTARRIARKGDSRRTLRVAPVVVLALVLALSSAAAEADTSVAQPLSLGASPLTRVIDQPETRMSRARLTRAAISWSGGPTTATTGETVNVYVSAALPVELGTPQTWADFLAGLVHGPELSALTAYIATFEEMQEVCGEHALGCYGANRMMSIGETAFGVTAAEVVRHEYGHHIAFNRLNPPWQAVAWGPKNWASTQNICRRAKEGSAYPGDEGDRYSLNPGEAWAETYRLLVERKAGATGSGWEIVDSSFYPDDAALQAAERDVLQPWATGTSAGLRKNLSNRGKRVWTIPLETPLDGLLEATVTLPKNGLHEVVLLDADRGTVLAKGLWASRTTKRVTTTVCGERSLTLRITQSGGFGRVSVVVLKP
jgi:hypothetical protein